MANQTTPARTQQEVWNDLVGEAWVRHQSLHDQQAAPFGAAARQALGALDGADVLDVGCGTGATTFELVTGGAGSVLGVDLSVRMITAARAANGQGDARFEVGDVLELDRPSSFDLIFSRFGVMFFTDPAPAFAHLRALGRPDARLAFCSWAPPADNQWMLVPVMATTPVLGPPTLAGPGEPGPFSLASPQAIADVLGQAGWNDVLIDELSIVQAHPAGDASAVARVVVEFSPPIVEGLLRHPGRREAALDAITEALRPFERDGVVHLQASAHIVAARA